MDNPTEPFLVARSCTWFNPETKQNEDCTLDKWRAQSAYVLLGDPGMGKTAAFRQEAREVGGIYFSARDFCELEPSDDGEIFFIDGLDEMRSVGMDGKTPLGQIRKHLLKLEKPRFRLSCRAADWFGVSDADDLRAVSPDGKIVELQLKALTDADVLVVLGRNATVEDPASFIAQADKHGLKDLLHNPQNLTMLLDAVQGHAWPASRRDVYQMACEKLIKEPNRNHRNQEKSTHQTNSHDALLKAAGYLCAIQLLSGLAGFATDDAGKEANQFASLNELLNQQNLPLLAALKTRIFQGDGKEHCWPTHRSVAEFLAARFIAQAIQDDGLPLGRVLALMSGSDGGIVSELRGLGAWLAVYCPSARQQLITRDPLGVVLYGDARHFTVVEKEQIWAALWKEAERYTGFRSEHSLPHQFGALAGPDMLAFVRNKLNSPSRSDADQALLLCILDAVEYGGNIEQLHQELDAIVRDSSYWSYVRNRALDVLTQVQRQDICYQLSVLQDIWAGLIADDDDEMLGILLAELYPKAISTENILDYFRVPRRADYYGMYWLFFSSNLLALTPKDDLPILLEQLVKRGAHLMQTIAARRHVDIVGPILVQGVYSFGDDIDEPRLYDWLGLGLDEFQEERIDSGHAQQIRTWLEQRPEKYKAILAQGLLRHEGRVHAGREAEQWQARLYNAEAPSDMVDWYLGNAGQLSGELAEYCFTQAVFLLQRSMDGKLCLPPENLESLVAWIAEHPSFQSNLEPFITCSLNDSQQKRRVAHSAAQARQQEFKASWLKIFRENQATIRDGSAYPGIFSQLASIYNGQWEWKAGATPEKLLRDFFVDENEVFECVFDGFRQVVMREDLPDATQIIQAATSDQGYSLGTSCLIGMALRYADDAQSALQLEDKVLSRLIVFHYVGSSDDDPAWYRQLLQERPKLLASVMSPYVIAMLNAKKPFVNALTKLAHDDAYTTVAPLVLPAILRAFPLRAGKEQVRFSLGVLLQAGLQFLDPSELLVLVAEKLQRTSLDIAQRVYWLACGLVLEPQRYEQEVLQTVDGQQVRTAYLAQFFYFGRYQSLARLVNLPVSTRKLLIAILAADYTPGGASKTMAEGVWETVDLLRHLIAGLGNAEDKNAGQALEHLLAQPQLAHWEPHLRAALYAQRSLQRKLSFQPVNSKDVCNMLANLAPASAADLAALVGHHLRDIGQHIRHANTDDYKQYWSYSPDNKQLEKSKPENDCRDALLSDLKLRLEKLNIDAIREGSYAEDKRADIRVSCHAHQRSWNVPIEIKKSTHSDLWTAMQQQLIPRYVRDPETGGYGIYLVFWFGESGMPLGPNAKRPGSATELEAMLRATLATTEQARIQVCVIDCALPPKGKPKKDI